ncbi:metallophosphoesterase [Glutamicibacter sp.]|uniref:metallophosphoesterase family protein n=1 Tax=Glutamicibacter sp. TaxID=1931995 RepID=UPI0028BEF358|nr:metallophosphoesterase [Glutamicibacter sp.]
MNGELRLVHLSDTHLSSGNRLLSPGIDPWSKLAQALCAAEEYSPDAVVITGDIADRGDRIHRDAARLLREAQHRLGTPIITIPGNHDPVGSIGSQFNTTRISTGPRPANTVHEIKGLRIIGLDSGGFQQAQGELDQDQLLWLRRLLSGPAPRGTLLLLHHPPLESFSPVLAGRGLRNIDELNAVITHRDVRAILCGHYHQLGASHLSSTPVFMAPSTAFNMNPLNPTQILDQQDAWFSVIKVSTDSVVSVPASSSFVAANSSLADTYLSLRRR